MFYSVFFVNKLNSQHRCSKNQVLASLAGNKKKWLLSSTGVTTFHGMFLPSNRCLIVTSQSASVWRDNKALTLYSHVFKLHYVLVHCFLSWWHYVSKSKCKKKTVHSSKMCSTIALKTWLNDHTINTVVCRDFKLDEIFNNIGISTVLSQSQSFVRTTAKINADAN